VFVLAVTGGIGSGKSTATAFFESRGAIVLDLDDIAKRLLEPDMPGYRAVLEEFGPEILGDDGLIEHARLAAVAFATPEMAHELDALMHPPVYAMTVGALDALALQAQPPRVVIIDVPLLVEAPLFIELVDAVLAISSDEDTRIDRLRARGMAVQDAERRIACQASDAERREIADYVIENDGDLKQYREDLAAFWDGEVAPRVA
jgi:dephospho-CoA kinase